MRALQFRAIIETPKADNVRTMQCMFNTMQKANSAVKGWPYWKRVDKAMRGCRKETRQCVHVYACMRV